MLWLNVEMVAHEQHLDHLRRAEQERLANEVAEQRQGGGLWQSLRQSLAGHGVEAKQVGGKLVEKTA